MRWALPVAHQATLPFARPWLLRGGTLGLVVLAPGRARTWDVDCTLPVQIYPELHSPFLAHDLYVGVEKATTPPNCPRVQSRLFWQRFSIPELHAEAKRGMQRPASCSCWVSRDACARGVASRLDAEKVRFTRRPP